MFKKLIKKIAAVISLTISLLMIFSVGSMAIDEFAINEIDNFIGRSGLNSSGIEELKIVSDPAILEGASKQMKLKGYEENGLFGSVVWSSSDESVISCTRNGTIKGLKKGYATITVETNAGDMKDTIKVYCAKKLNKSEAYNIASHIALSFKTPNLFGSFPSLHFKMLGFLVTEKLNVMGVYGSYFYVRFQRNGTLHEHFISQHFMPNGIADEEIFRQISANEIVVFSGETSSQKITTNYKGHVSWRVSDESVVYFDRSSGTVTAKRPGTAIISATVGTKTLSCMVFSVGKWMEPETSVSENTVYVRSVPAMTGKITATLPVGTIMTANGDMENGLGWIYITSDIAKGFILLSDFPGIDYLMSEYHYYDQGFSVRYESPFSKIKDYTNVLNDVMMDLFGLKVCSYIESYTSPADQCKVWTYGSVTRDNLVASCPRTDQHLPDSCLTYQKLHEILASEKGKGTDWVAKCVWTGHILEKNTTSRANILLKTISFTTGNFINPNTYADYNSNRIRINRLYEIVHETAHLLGTVDGYCLNDNGSNHCSNVYCYTCNGEEEPVCIMAQLFSPENADIVFCDECKETIKNHLNDHH